MPSDTCGGREGGGGFPQSHAVSNLWLASVGVPSGTCGRVTITCTCCCNNIENFFTQADADIHEDADMHRLVLGDSGGVVNSLDFCPASLKSLGCFYFRCALSSQWKAVTVNL